MHFRSSLLRTRKAHRRKLLNTTQYSWVTKKWGLALELNYHLSLKDRIDSISGHTLHARSLTTTHGTLTGAHYGFWLWWVSDLLFPIEEYKKSLVVLSMDLKIKAVWKASFTLQTINPFLVRWKPWFFLRRFHLSDPPKLRRACLQSSSSSRYLWAIVFKILHWSDSNQAFLWLKISWKTEVPTNGDSSTDLTE